MSRGLAYPLAFVVFGIGPWAFSVLTPRYGWAGRPGLGNLLGLIPVVVGTAGLIGTMGLHFAQAPEGIKLSDENDAFVVTTGPLLYPHKSYRIPKTVTEGALIIEESRDLFIYPEKKK